MPAKQKQDFNINDLPEIARKVRLGIIDAVHAAGSGHPGGALGLADFLVALYCMAMNIDPKNPAMPERDRFVLSPAQMVPGLYSTLAHRGFFPVALLKTLRSIDSKLQGHTYRDLELGVETTGGSLAQGISIACGMALAAKLDSKDWRTYCVISDGELNEGQTWEALMFSVKEKLDNLTIILDKNDIQQSGDTKDIVSLEPMRPKFEAFNFAVLEVDGHNFTEILFALNKAKLTTGKPTLIISHSIPGKGVSYMEGEWEWHGKAPDDKQYEQAVKELIKK
jgi:transketolase